MGYRNYSVANGFIVDKLGNGDFTTIATALTAAVSGDTIFIRPGTYTENPTLKAGVNLVAYEADAFTPNVIINGNCTLSTAGTVTCSGINFQTNSAAAITVSGTVASILNLKNCYINALNNTAITYSSSSASSFLNIFECNGNIGTTGIALFANTSNGQMIMYQGRYTNTGASTTANTCGTGANANMFYCSFANPFSCTSTGNFFFSYCNVNSGVVNTTALTTAGTGLSTIEYSDFLSGTASAISVGSGTTVDCFGPCVISSSNTNAVTGTGTLNTSLLTFTSSSSLINTSSVVQYPTYPALPTTFKQGSWTPALAFGGSSTGITYSTQTGYYVQVGNVVMFSLSIALSSKGAQTGNAAITGLPVTTTANGVNNSTAVGFWQGLTLTALYTTVNLQPRVNDTTMAIEQMGSAQTGVILTNTAFSNSSLIIASGLYTVY